jgi:hypothetical protein
LSVGQVDYFFLWVRRTIHGVTSDHTWCYLCVAFPLLVAQIRPLVGSRHYVVEPSKHEGQGVPSVALLSPPRGLTPLRGRVLHRAGGCASHGGQDVAAGAQREGYVLACPRSSWTYLGYTLRDLNLWVSGSSPGGSLFSSQLSVLSDQLKIPIAKGLPPLTSRRGRRRHKKPHRRVPVTSSPQKQKADQPKC